MNLAFVANLFNNCPSLDKPDIDWNDIENMEETREEKSKLVFTCQLPRTGEVHVSLTLGPIYKVDKG